jgi:hypothetical protein
VTGSGGAADNAAIRVHITGPGTVRIVTPATECHVSCEQSLPKGSRVHLDAVAADGAAFQTWGGACSGNGSCDVVLNADADVEATFAAIPPPPGNARLSVTIAGTGAGHVTSTPPGIDCPGTCDMTVQQGTNVTLHGAPQSGATFDGWSGGCGGNGDCALTLGTDTKVTGTFTAPPPPDDCAGYAPPTPGSPKSFVASRGPGPVSYCEAGTADGTGSLALGAQNGAGERLYTNVSFVDVTSNAVLGTYSARDPHLIYQQSGFEGVDVSSGASGPAAWHFMLADRTGKVTKTLDDAGPLVANNPIGGIVAIRSSNNHLVSYDENGNVRFEVQVSPDAWPNVDRAGNLLVLWRDVAAKDFSKYYGQWFDPAGKPGPVFVAVDNLPQNYQLAMYPRVGSGLFLHMSSWQSGSTSPPTSSWPRQFEPLVAASAPAPDWLVARPETRIHMAHGGHAYAMLPLPGQNASVCSQRIEVVSPTGKSCGFASFDISASACTTQSLDVGYDGTVVQQLPREMEHNDPTGATNSSCTWRYWPGYFQ